ncbi:MAG TPA: ATP-binding protein [Candidatus Tectomicrobia bacterium]|nr:ATP-binding protein [Candidatus Tectomicrobia bacterium]
MSKLSGNPAVLFPPITAIRDVKSTLWGMLRNLPRRALQLIRGSLRAKFIVLIVSLEIVLMGAVTFVVEGHQRRAILEQTRARALSLGTGLAALSEGYLLSYNFVKLEQTSENVTTSEADVVYSVAHLRDGKVAAFSGRNDLQGKILDDPVSQQALTADTPLVQQILIPETKEPGYDVAIPVYAPGSSTKWGMIRLGFSLKRAYERIHRTRRDLALLGLASIFCGTSLAVFLAMRISKPVGQLVVGVHRFAGGAYDRPIRVDASDEIGYLAAAFERMRTSLRQHLANLAEEKQRLEETNRQLQETQQQLLQSERLAAVGKLAARVAHEVNNPLAIIKTAICIMGNQTPADEATNAHLKTIEEEINRIARILRELLDFSRPSPLEQMVDVNAVIQSLELLLAQNLQEKHIALSVLLDPAVPQVRISADHLKQVLLNLVRNAEDAMPSGGHLRIQTGPTDDGIEVSVTDTGCGIAPEHIPYLFDPFFTTKAAQGGMGLGLSVLYGIIKNAHGRIEVESEVGKGSALRVILPAYKV